MKITRNLFAVALIVSVAIGCSGKSKTSSPEIRNKAIIMRAWEEVMNQGNMAVVGDLFSTDYVFHSVGGPEARGLDAGVKAPVAAVHSAFPDIHYTVEDMIADGDIVVHRWSATGTHKGPFMGIPPTDSAVSMIGIVVSRFAEGKIVEDWSYADQLGLLQQLGVAPGMGRTEFTWGVAADAPTGAPSDPEQNKALVRREVYEVWNQQNTGILDEIMLPGMVSHDPNRPMVLGMSAAREWAAVTFIGFPDMTLTIDTMYADKKHVVTMWTQQGTHTGDLPGLPATGNSVQIKGIVIHRFADGKIAESWWSRDMLGLLKQLGAIPEPEAAS